MSRTPSSKSNHFILSGLAMAVLVGIVLGYLRYWMGFFIIAQGVCLGLLVPWLAVRLSGGKKPDHPGVGGAMTLALVWFLAAQAGLMIGFGLAQPWFEPLGWFLRIMDDRTAEFVFGIATNTGFARGVALGAQGGFWLFLNILDWLIMFFFLWIMPWSGGGRKESGPEATEAAS